MRDLAYDWDMKMINNFPDHQGTALAVDGIVIETIKPTESEAHGNLSRKGFFGWLLYLQLMHGLDFDFQN